MIGLAEQDEEGRPADVVGPCVFFGALMTLMQGKQYFHVFSKVAGHLDI